MPCNSSTRTLVDFLQFNFIWAITKGEVSPQPDVAERRVTEQELCGCAICVNTNTTDQG
jgi:hypothetical protein